MKPLRIAIRSFADFQSALAAQIAAYRELHPEVEIEVVAFDLPSLEDAVLGGNGLRSGEWDLAIFPTDWIGSAINTGTIENLTPWMQSNPLPDWPEGWPASLREPLRHGDDFYCIPWHDGPECLIYRKDLFENPEEKKAFASAIRTRTQASNHMARVPRNSPLLHPPFAIRFTEPSSPPIPTDTTPSTTSSCRSGVAAANSTLPTACPR